MSKGKFPIGTRVVLTRQSGGTADWIPVGTRGRVVKWIGNPEGTGLLVEFDGFPGDYEGDGAYGCNSDELRIFSPLEQLAECADEDS